jgi:cobalt/nickel transport protein
VRRHLSTRALIVVGLLMALLLAGGVSALASKSPDGLTRTAQERGFAKAEKRSVPGGQPLKGYQTPGLVEGDRSGGVAGIAGSVVVLALMSGIVVVVRRRRVAPEA